ncbi:MAG: rod shape-determining protein MreD [Spirochaetales bacterium]|nr:rod shape-determining protein MreD [Spirochaetales bacterium]
MSKSNGFIGVIVLFITIILQSTILTKISINGIKPDFVLVIIILYSNYFGKIKGQLLGFSSGLVVDFLSLSPLGFNSLINTIIGYLAGATSGKIFLDSIVVPIIFVFIGTLVKALFSYVLLSLFIAEKAGSIFSSFLITEFALNIIITPFLYLFLKLIRVFPSSNNSRIS